MNISLSFDVYNKEWKTTLKGKKTYNVSMGNDAVGNIIRIDNTLDTMHAELKETKNRLTNYLNEIKQIEVTLKKPFEFEEKLNEQTKRLAEVELDLSKSEDVIGKSHTEQMGDEINANGELNNTKAQVEEVELL